MPSMLEISVNACFAKLSKAGFISTHEAQAAPAGFGPAIRMDSIQVAGPLPSLRAQHEIAQEKVLKALKRNSIPTTDQRMREL